MITYELSLERQNLLGADKFSIAAQSNETISFRFHFDRSWRIFDTKAAVFRGADRKYYVLDIIGGCVTVPWEVLRNTNGFELAIVAYEDEVVLTSKKVRIAVESSLLPEVCRQLSPTETLFDRIAEEAKNKAFLDYKDEIKNLKHTHSDELIELGEKIEAERRNTEAVKAQKNAEIEELNYQASCRETELRRQISELNTELAKKQEKAANWDLIDKALSGKTTVSNTLWGGGTEPFALPTLNTSSIVSFSSSGISNNITSVGFNVASATSLADTFYAKTNLEYINLVCTENITNMKNAFNGDIRLKKAYLGSPDRLSNCENIFLGCKNLEYISMGNPKCITNLTSAFNGCTTLREIDALIDMTLCKSAVNSFYNCVSLETIRFAENSISINLDFSSCINISKESIYSIVLGLSNETINNTVTFSEHAFNAKLSPAERSEIYNIARNQKHWTVDMA